MGLLVKTAQTVENRIELVREQCEPKLRAKFRDAKAEWFELRSRGSKSAVKRMELGFKAAILREDIRLRVKLGKFLGRVIVELERLRRTLPPEK